MPIYEFRCVHCGHVYELLTRLDESGENLECPECKGIGGRKLMSVFSARGLENGHHGVGKTWGKKTGSSGDNSGDSSGKSDSSAARAEAS